MKRKRSACNFRCQHRRTRKGGAPRKGVRVGGSGHEKFSPPGGLFTHLPEPVWQRQSSGGVTPCGTHRVRFESTVTGSDRAHKSIPLTGCPALGPDRGGRCSPSCRDRAGTWQTVQSYKPSSGSGRRGACNSASPVRFQAARCVAVAGAWARATRAPNSSPRSRVGCPVFVSTNPARISRPAERYS